MTFMSIRVKQVVKMKKSICFKIKVRLYNLENLQNTSGKLPIFRKKSGDVSKTKGLGENKGYVFSKVFGQRL